MSNDQQYGSSGDLGELLDALASVATDELRVTEAAALEVILESVGGQQQSAVDIAAKIDALEDALASVGSDQLQTALVDRAGRNLGKTRLMDSSETLVDPATESTLSSELSREIATWTAGTLPVEQQTPVGVEDTTGSQVDPLDSSDRTSVSDVSTSTGAANAARVDLGDHRAFVSVGWDLSGAATITVEGSNDGGSTWHPIRQFSPSSGEIDGVDLTAGWQEVRVYADSNLNEVNIAGKGA